MVEVKGKYCGPGKHAYYLAGINLTEYFTASVDWKSNTPGKILWITPSTTYEDPCPSTTVSRPFEMGDDFAENGTLEVVAISNDQSVQSNPYLVNLDVISQPPILNPSENP